jgi:LCP family protein required for cell wall assembly
MIRRAIPLIALLLGIIALGACRGAGEPSVRPTSTAHYTIPIPISGDPPTPPPNPRSRPEATTVLLLGADRRGSSSVVDNTDTLMLFHLDPDARHAVLLSIPRDLYVEIPGHGPGRINTAYAWGEQDGTGGLALARHTVSATLGIPVHHAVLLEFHAFVTLIDAIGGVDVDVPAAIVDPTYPDSDIGYEPFALPAGQHHLDGATALKYARTRATYGGDFDRTARQRRLALAVRDRITRLDLLPDLIAQSPQLWAALQTAFETDLTLAEIVDLAVVTSRIPADQIATAGIDQSCTRAWVTPGGASVLVADSNAMEALITALFAPPPAAMAAQ